MRALPLLLALLAAATLAGSALAQTADEDLAGRYAPIVRLQVQAEACGDGEPYEPIDVDAILDNVEVAFRGPWDDVNLIQTAPSAELLGSGFNGYHLDFPPEALDPGCDFEEWADRITAGTEPTLYARVLTEPGRPGELALQYWFYYVFNDFNNKHEGDWEMIQLIFDADDAEAALRTEPRAVGYSQHEGAERADWGDEKLETVDGTHPVVYPASGSHANYFVSNLFLGRSAAQGVGCDDTTGPSRDLRPRIAVVPSAMDEYLAAYPWLGFEGRWGELHPAFFNGPTGPNVKPQWTQPISWAEETWRDQSFPIPGGTTLFPAATDFFCSAVDAGSTVLIRVTQNPSLAIITVFALLGLLVYAATRTTWQPSAPLRLARRRATGQLLAASRRLYFGHLRLWIAIGLVFIPIAIVVAALQSGLFYLTGLNAFIDATDESSPAVQAVVFGLSFGFNLVGLAIVQAVVARAMVAIDRDGEARVLDVYRVALAERRPLLRTVIGVTIAVTLLSLTLFLIPVAVWLVVRWSLLAQTSQLELASVRESLSRSGALVRGRWWRTALVVVGFSALAFVLGPLLGALLLLGSDASFSVVNIVAGMVYVLTMPFVAIVTTYVYFDLRVREQIEPDQTTAVLPREAEVVGAEAAHAVEGPAAEPSA